MLGLLIMEIIMYSNIFFLLLYFLLLFLLILFKLFVGSGIVVFFFLMIVCFDVDVIND